MANVNMTDFQPGDDEVIGVAVVVDQQTGAVTEKPMPASTELSPAVLEFNTAVGALITDFENTHGIKSPDSLMASYIARNQLHSEFGVNGGRVAPLDGLPGPGNVDITPAEIAAWRAKLEDTLGHRVSDIDIDVMLTVFFPHYGSNMKDTPATDGDDEDSLDVEVTNPYKPMAGKLSAILMPLNHDIATEAYQRQKLGLCEHLLTQSWPNPTKGKEITDGTPRVKWTESDAIEAVEILFMLYGHRGMRQLGGFISRVHHYPATAGINPATESLRMAHKYVESKSMMLLFTEHAIVPHLLTDDTKDPISNVLRAFSGARRYKRVNLITRHLAAHIDSQESARVKAIVNRKVPRDQVKTYQEQADMFEQLTTGRNEPTWKAESTMAEIFHIMSLNAPYLLLMTSADLRFRLHKLGVGKFRNALMHFLRLCKGYDQILRPLQPLQACIDTFLDQGQSLMNAQYRMRPVHLDLQPIKYNVGKTEGGEVNTLVNVVEQVVHQIR